MGERGSHDFHLKIDLFWSSFSSIHWLPVQAVRPSSGFLKKGKTRTDLSHHLVVGGKAWEVKKKVEEVEFQWKFILQICGSSNPQFQSFGCLLCFFFWDHSSPVMFRTRSLDKETMNWCRVQVAKALSLDFWQTDATHGFCGSLIIVEFHWSRSRGKGKGWIQFWGFIYMRLDFNKQAALKHYLTVDWGGSRI